MEAGFTSDLLDKITLLATHYPRLQYRRDACTTKLTPKILKFGPIVTMPGMENVAPKFCNPKSSTCSVLKVSWPNASKLRIVVTLPELRNRTEDSPQLLRSPKSP